MTTRSEDGSLKADGTAEISVPMILAQRVLDLFEENGATLSEQEASLKIVRVMVEEKTYEAIRRASRPG